MDTITKNKSAEFHHAVSDIIKNRKSVRSFEDRPIESAKINSLFEAARWAPSGGNDQPWLYLFATKDQPELWGKLFDCVNDVNKVWAKNAPLLIVSLARKNLSFRDAPNTFALFDLGAANAFLSLEAVELGLQLRQMGGYSRDKAKELLNVPDSYQFGTMIAVGYPGEAELLHETLQEKERAPRERFLQDTFAMNTTF